MRVALDTNVLAYAEGLNGTEMRAAALELLQCLPAEAVHIPVQALGELFQVLIKKARHSPQKARAAILNWRDAFPLIDTSASVMLAAADLVVDHKIGVWDSVILSAAAEAECRLLLSEDLQNGFTWRGVTVTNPFLSSKHPVLAALLQRES